MSTDTTGTTGSLTHTNPLPREIAPGVHWLGECLAVPFRGRVLHQYASTFLVEGADGSVLVEGGATSHTDLIARQIDALLERGAPPLRQLFVSHGEIPHAGGVGKLLERHPRARVCGDTTDLALIFPEHADRIDPMQVGSVLDLGDRELVVVEAVFRDLITTQWLFDRRERVLFASDGFAFSHYHDELHCGHLGEETAPTLPIADQVALFALAAFHWTQYVDVEPYIERLDTLLFDELDVRVVAPTHGLPFADPRGLMPEIRRGLRLGSATLASGSLAEET